METLISYLASGVFVTVSLTALLTEKLKYWHSLAPLDEDELLRRLELHIGDLPEEVKEKSSLAIGLIERRRQSLRAKLAKEHPEILDHLMMKENF